MLVNMRGNTRAFQQNRVPVPRQTRSDRCPRHDGFIDVFLLRRVHTDQGLDRLDHPLGFANEIAVDLLRRQVLDHAGEEPGEVQDLAVRSAHGG
jgi:hypothetical protein